MMYGGHAPQQSMAPMVMGALFVGLGIVQALVLMGSMAPPFPEPIIYWGTAVGAVWGGFKILTMRRPYGY